MEWFASTGATIYVPVGHSPDCDFVAQADGRLLRVQVKTSTCHRNDRWEVTLATRGGNQSWSGLARRLDPGALRLPLRPRCRWPALVHPFRSRRRMLGHPPRRTEV
jgi:hypothetical protein